MIERPRQDGVLEGVVTFNSVVFTFVYITCIHQGTCGNSYIHWNDTTILLNTKWEGAYQNFCQIFWIFPILYNNNSVFKQGSITFAYFGMKIGS